LIAAYGDSGSWVVETDSGNLCGHIIAGDLSTGLGYVFPAKAVFQQIEHQLVCRIELPESGSLDSGPFSVPTDPLDTKAETDQPYSLNTVGEDVAETDKGNGKEIALPQDRKADVLVTGPIIEILDKEKRRIDPPDTGPDNALPRVSRSSELSASTRPTNREVAGPMSRSSRRREIERYSRDDHIRDRRAVAASAKINEYFVPKDGIDREVITADICRYLGNDALVRPGNYEVCSQLLLNFNIILMSIVQNPQTRQIQQGYFITAYRNMTTVSRYTISAKEILITTCIVDDSGSQSRL
jgi:hypothetical protein